MSVGPLRCAGSLGAVGRDGKRWERFGDTHKCMSPVQHSGLPVVRLGRRVQVARQIHGLVQEADDLHHLVVETKHDDVGRGAHGRVGDKLSRGDSQGIEAQVADFGGVGGRAIRALMQGFDRERDKAAIAPCRVAAMAGDTVGQGGVDIPLGARGDQQFAHVRPVGGRGCPARP